MTRRPAVLGLALVAVASGAVGDCDYRALAGYHYVAVEPFFVADVVAAAEGRYEAAA